MKILYVIFLTNDFLHRSVQIYASFSEKDANKKHRELLDQKMKSRDISIDYHIKEIQVPDD